MLTTLFNPVTHYLYYTSHTAMNEPSDRVKQYFAAKMYTVAWSFEREEWVPYDKGAKLYTLDEAQGHADGWNKRGVKPQQGCNTTT